MLTSGNRLRIQDKASRTPPLVTDFDKAIRLLIATNLVNKVFQLFGRAKRRPPRLKAWELIYCLVYHFLHPVGTFSEHVKQVTGKIISDSAL